MSVIGNKNEFAFEILPVRPSWERRYAPEQAGWGATAIWVDGRNLCSHVVPGANELREWFYIPLGPIVDWFVQALPALEYEERAANFPTGRRLHNAAARWGDAAPPAGIGDDAWVDEREDWWSRHFLRAGADGSRVPDLAFARDNEELVIEWQKPSFPEPLSPVMLYPDGEFAVPWSTGLQVLDQFASRVSEWLRQEHAEETFEWAGEERPLGAQPVSLIRAVELLTGRDQQTLNQLFHVHDLDQLLAVLGLSSDALDPGASSQCQILRDLSPAVTEDASEVLRSVGDQSRAAVPERTGRWIRHRSIALDAARSASTLEEAGQLGAQALRSQLGIDGSPVADLATVTQQCGMRYEHHDVWGGPDRMMVASQDKSAPTAVTLMSHRTAHLWGQRFEASRALGHALLDPVRSGALGAASSPFAQASRRRRSGAFAAEFLLPEAALMRASGGRLDAAAEDVPFQRLMENYGVGARTAAFQLWNRGWLSAPTVRDELIDRFSATG